MNKNIYCLSNVKVGKGRKKERNVLSLSFFSNYRIFYLYMLVKSGKKAISIGHVKEKIFNETLTSIIKMTNHTFQKKNISVKTSNL
jgi:hypothetical protein